MDGLAAALYERDCQAVVDAMLGRVADALVAGDRVELRGFGSFALKERQARAERNLRIGAPVSVSAKGALVFKAGREMQRRLNPLGSAPSILRHPMPDLRVEPREHPRVNSQAEARPERSGIASGRP